MKPIAFLCAAACGVTVASAELKTIDVGANPESVTKGFGGNYYVTLMGPTRNPGDGDGGIVVIEDGAVKPFVSGLHDPKGIVFLEDSLITADFTQVWRIDSKGEKKLLAGPEAFPHPILFLNDVAIAADGKSVLVTDMGARDKIAGPDGFWPLDSAEAKAVPAVGRIYQITLDGKVTEVIPADGRMKCPNGVDVTADGKIRIAEFFTGTIYECGGEGAFKVLAEGHRSADAIVHDSKGNYYVTEVRTGNVWKYPGKVKMGEGLTAAADAFVDEKAGFLIVPETKAGKLVFLPL
ncbi:MAG: gluconolaconase [Verrucomicrobiaceae bacterium]|nr:MAG: gluconolaconase [Verrucomicrobiaceae bacterium]